MYDWEKNLDIRKDYFLYKGEAYSYHSGDNLSIHENYEMINVGTQKSIILYGGVANIKDFISEEDLYKIKIKYQVKKSFFDIETFDTKEEAEYFINLIAKKSS